MGHVRASRSLLVLLSGVLVAAFLADPAGAADPHQADMWIAKQKDALQGNFKGKNTYDAGSADQTVTIKKPPGKTATFRAVLENDGVVGNFLSLRGDPGNSKFGVTYLDLSGNNITSELLSENGRILGPVPLDHKYTVVVKIEVKARAKPGDVFVAKLTGRGHDNPTSPPPAIPPVLTTDVVKAKVKVK